MLVAWSIACPGWHPVVRPELAAGTRLVIVRHGEAVSNAEDIIAGHLTLQGPDRSRPPPGGGACRPPRRTNELAGAVAALLEHPPAGVETAEILAPALGESRGAADVRASASAMSARPTA